MRRQLIRFRPAIESLEQRRFMDGGSKTNSLNTYISEMNEFLSIAAPNSATRDLFIFSQSNVKNLQINQNNDNYLYNEILQNEEFQGIASRAFRLGKTPVTGSHSFHSGSPHDNFKFSNGDLHYAINKLDGGLSWKGTKNADGSGTITMTMKDKYDFNSFKDLKAFIKDLSGPKDLASRVGLQLGAELQKAGLIHPYDLEASVTYYFAPGSTQPLTSPPSTSSYSDEPPGSQSGQDGQYPYINTWTGSYTTAGSYEEYYSCCTGGVDSYVTLSGTISVTVNSATPIPTFSYISGSITLSLEGQTITFVSNPDGGTETYFGPDAYGALGGVSLNLGATSNYGDVTVSGYWPYTSSGGLQDGMIIIYEIYINLNINGVPYSGGNGGLATPATLAIA